MPKRFRAKTKPKIYLTQWRERAGLSQAELASLMGTTDETVSRYENGKRVITTEGLVAAALALHIMPGQLFTHPDRVSIDAVLRDQPAAVVERALVAVQELLRPRRR